MTNATATTTPDAQKTRMMKAVQANEWGQITDLEPQQTYYVMRKPTRELTKERANAMMEEFKTFLQDQRLVTDKQLQQFQEKYGEPAKAKAKEIRTTLERRFDEIAKEVEARVEKLEEEFQTRAPQVSQALKGRKSDKPSGDQAPAPHGASGETPGEMPTGEGNAETPAQAETRSEPETGGESSSNAAGRKKGARKNE